jgi:hypothetical protein
MVFLQLKTLQQTVVVGTGLFFSATHFTRQAYIHPASHPTGKRLKFIQYLLGGPATGFFGHGFKRIIYKRILPPGTQHIALFSMHHNVCGMVGVTVYFFLFQNAGICSKI